MISREMGNILYYASRSSLHVTLIYYVFYVIFSKHMSFRSKHNFCPLNMDHSRQSATQALSSKTISKFHFMAHSDLELCNIATCNSTFCLQNVGSNAQLTGALWNDMTSIHFA